MSSQRPKWVLKHAKGQRILDIGFVGEDAHSGSLHKAIRAQNPEAAVTGLDTNKKAMDKLGLPGCVEGSFLDMPFEDASFDLVVISEVIEHVIESEPGFAEIARVLEKGGRVIVTTPCPYGFFRLLKHWVFAPRLVSRSNFRGFLGNEDHKLFWEPLSLMNLLNRHGLVTEVLTTRNLDLPYLPRFLKNPPLHFWPFNRMGSYLCIVARKK